MVTVIGLAILLAASPAHAYLPRPMEDWSAKDQPVDGGIPVTYHGGAVMNAPPRVYFIWYGDWSNDQKTMRVLADLAGSLGNSAYFATNEVYGVDPGLSLGGQIADRYSNGQALQDGWSINPIQDVGELIGGQDPMASGTLGDVVAKSIDAGLGLDPNGIYVILPSADVAPPPKYGEFCGWHSHTRIHDADIKYVFVGNIQARDKCGWTQASPNGDSTADAMANVLAHEINETVTDPDSDGYFDAKGQEVGDKCAWNFGDEQTDASGASYNVTLGSRNFLLQQNWVNEGSGGHCSLGEDFVASQTPDDADSGMGGMAQRAALRARSSAESSDDRPSSAIRARALRAQ